MNYFKARYFGAKYNIPFALPPDEVIDVNIEEKRILKAPGKRPEFQSEEEIKEQNELIIAICKTYIQCLNLN